MDCNSGQSSRHRPNLLLEHFQNDHTEVNCQLVAEIARNFGAVRLKVTGTSMLPAIWPGDTLTIRRRSIEQLRPGQVVLCYRNQGLVAHRLIGRVGDRLITRGDSLSDRDVPFSQDEFLGEVVSVVRGGRAVDPSPAWWRHTASWILRHSELCIRILLRLKRPIWAS